MVKTYICIPTLDDSGLLSSISMHFGKASYFTFIKLENGKIKEITAIENEGKHNGGAGMPTEFILDRKVDILICGGLGTKAKSMLQHKGIEVISGASGKVKNIFDEWKVGMLQLADENLCRNCSKDYWAVIK